jgi:uncharacterized protein
MMGATVAHVLTSLGHGLREAFFMFWITLWALLLGFILSGAVQSFASRRRLHETLGNHRAPAVVRASGYGMVSSSCSYAATAMAKSLFAKGADFVSSMIFMFASTNLVVELGIVLIVLIGWQFALGEFVGGIIMIGLLALIGTALFTARSVAGARSTVEAGAADHHHDHGGAEAGNSVDFDLPLPQRLRNRDGWIDASSYTMADLTMLRREIVIGYLVAGFLAALVPATAWHALFIPGHGLLTTIENVIVGPFIAIVSCVCSIGNVPLAAALWSGGISFGGVISFLFADLLALPILFIYRTLYGWRMALRMLLGFWAVMSTAGLLTEYLFRALGIIPTRRPLVVSSDHLAWNYTTFLNVIFLGVFAVTVWLSKQPRSGATSRLATDPVCGMQVERLHAPAITKVRGETVYFCSDQCRNRYRNEHAAID